MYRLFLHNCIISIYWKTVKNIGILYLDYVLFIWSKLGGCIWRLEFSSYEIKLRNRIT